MSLGYDSFNNHKFSLVDIGGPCMGLFDTCKIIQLMQVLFSMGVFTRVVDNVYMQKVKSEIDSFKKS
jgi:hypothetical protein